MRPYFVNIALYITDLITNPGILEGKPPTVNKFRRRNTQVPKTGVCPPGAAFFDAAGLKHFLRSLKH
jgi:hypothetical protein